ncbi:putative Pectin lyase E [Seiridium cardinale]|uniref:Pectin lyase E n=1 Tax=Seiridium cardinale TaxID=138064 RepID=A0ABR2Y461_9PEZI
MKPSHSTTLLSLATCQYAAAAAVSSRAMSSIVTRTPMGFGSAATGGGDATQAYPTIIDELKSYLTSDEA